MIAQDMYQLGASRSCIRELFEYGLRQAAVVGKENVYDFSLGNPSIPAPEEVRQAFVSLIAREDSLSVHGYTPAPGSGEARAAVAADLNARFGANIRPENLFLTCGAAPALISVIRALAVEGAEIMAIAPFFPEYRPFVENNGAKFVVVPADTDTFQIPVAEVEKRLTAHTQAIIVNSPNNPSGAIYSRENLLALGEVLKRKGGEFGHPIYIIADEPYRELVYDGAEVPFIPNLYPNTIVCYSWSKSLSLPGERIGYVCVPDQAAEQRGPLRRGGGRCPGLGPCVRTFHAADGGGSLRRGAAGPGGLRREPADAVRRPDGVRLPVCPASGGLLPVRPGPRRRRPGLLRQGQGEESADRPRRRLRLPGLLPGQHLRQPRHDPAQPAYFPGAHPGDEVTRHLPGDFAYCESSG